MSETTKKINLKEFIVCGENHIEAFKTIEKAVATYIAENNINDTTTEVSVGSAIDEDGKRWYAVADADIFVNVKLSELDDKSFLYWWDTNSDDKIVYVKYVSAE